MWSNKTLIDGKIYDFAPLLKKSLSVKKWRRRESTAEGEAEIPLKIKYFLFRQPHNSVSTATRRCNGEQRSVIFEIERAEFTPDRINHKKNDRENLSFHCIRYAIREVEAAGVEPASKLGAQRLSTRLFCD